MTELLLFLILVQLGGLDGCAEMLHEPPPPRYEPTPMTAQEKAAFLEAFNKNMDEEHKRDCPLHDEYQEATTWIAYTSTGSWTVGGFERSDDWRWWRDGYMYEPIKMDLPIILTEE